MTRRLVGLVCLAGLVTLCVGCGTTDSTLKELQRARAGSLDVIMLASGDVLRQGQNATVLEFRSSDGSLADVGAVKVNATMPMAGMGPMLADARVQPADVKGRYALESSFTMAGSWRFAIEWDGPAGKGSVTMPATVR